MTERRLEERYRAYEEMKRKEKLEIRGKNYGTRTRCRISKKPRQSLHKMTFEKQGQMITSCHFEQECIGYTQLKTDSCKIPRAMYNGNN